MPRLGGLTAAIGRPRLNPELTTGFGSWRLRGEPPGLGLTGLQPGPVAVDLALHAPLGKVAGEVFNIGTGRSISVLEIAGMISRAFGIEPSLDFMTERFGQVQRHISSVDKAEKVLGFRASTGFEDGLRSAIGWYRENRPIWEKQMMMRKVPVKTKDGKIVWY